jgi:cyanate permease
MTNHEARIMVLCGLVTAILLTAFTQIQYWYAKSHHLLTGPLATDDISQWLTEHVMWIITLFFGLIGGCFLYFIFWVVQILVQNRKPDARHHRE